jgi:hypothetical protein
VILSIIPNKEIIGIDEIVNKTIHRDYSIQVTSEKSFMLFMTRKDFQERILGIFPEVRKNLIKQASERNEFYS